MEKKYALSEIDDVAEEIIAQLTSNILCLEGDMGAGKTTLIKALCKAWGIEDSVSSPTFSLVNEYRNNKNEPFYHFDCYRLDSADEALDFGAEEYLNAGAQCFIEWSDRIATILPSDRQTLHIKKISTTERIITLSS